MLMTKQQAVEQLIGGAMQAHEAGQEAVAITLAGAAEGAMPEPTGQHLFAITRDAFTGYAEKGGAALSRNQVVAMLNVQRDWLKHHNAGQPEEMDLVGSFMMIIRAVSKFHAVYGREAETPEMQAFFAVARSADPTDG